MSLSFHEQQHIQKLLQQQGSIKYIFDGFVRRCGIHMEGWKDEGGSGVWARNKAIEKRIDQELKDLHSKLLRNIEMYTSDAWKRSHSKTDELVSEFIKDLPLNKLVKDGMYARNEEVLKTFLKRKVDNLSLSDRVWQLADGAKVNIEHYLQSGLATGRSAALISQDIRQVLKEPDRRFHRVRNKDGKLVPSAPMKNSLPGQGVYRSSYKNALRTAVTNTNEMYRITDHDRWQSLDFILGVEIKRSGSNKGPCSICNPLVGKYPKDFVFKGWHPWCICVATPIMQDEDAFMDSLFEENSGTPAGTIQDMPKGARDYFNEKIKDGKLSKDSYLLKENKSFFDGTKANKLAEAKKKAEMATKAKAQAEAKAKAEKLATEIEKKEAVKKAKKEAEKQKAKPLKASTVDGARKNLQVWKNNISPAQKNEILEYTKGNYEDINNKLRTTLKLSVVEKVQYKILKEALDNAPKYTGICYRGMRFKTRDKFLDFVDKAKNTNYISDKGFMSSSFDLEQAEIFALFSNYRVHITIKSKKGVLIDELSDLPGEKEILFNMRSKFKIESIKEEFDEYTGAEIVNFVVKEI